MKPDNFKLRTHPTNSPIRLPIIRDQYPIPHRASGMLVINGIVFEMILMNPRCLKFKSRFIIAISTEDIETKGMTREAINNTLPYPSEPTKRAKVSQFTAIIKNNITEIVKFDQKQILNTSFFSDSLSKRCWIM